MSTEIMPFAFEGAEVRALLIDGEPWWVARDVTDALGVDRTQTRYLDEDEKGVCPAHTPGGQQELAIINEPGLYSLVLRSRKPQAKAFKRWITHDVIPAIRKVGRYELPQAIDDPLVLAERNLELSIQTLRLVKEKRAVELERDAVKEYVAEIEPAAAAWDTFVSADGRDYTVRAAAQILSRDPAIEIGQNRLFKQLVALGVLDKHRRPYQHHIDAGHVALRAGSTYLHAKTREITRGEPQVMVTVTGLKYLHQKLGGVVSLHRHLAAETMTLFSITGGAAS